MKQIAIIGAGNFGKNLAISLTNEGAEVLVIDNNKSKIEDIKDMVARAVIADASRKDVLQELGLHDFDIVVVSVGNRLDISIMAILFLKELGAKQIIAKAANDDFAKALKLVGADEVVFPEKDTAIRLGKTILFGDIMEFIALSDEYSVMEIALNEKFVGKSLKELNFRNQYQLNVVAIKNALTDQIAVSPAADTVLKPDDSLVVLGENKNLEKFKKALGK
jgi:trk system potassium uptake protein TrkA